MSEHEGFWLYVRGLTLVYVFRLLRFLFHPDILFAVGIVICGWWRKWSVADTATLLSIWALIGPAPLYLRTRRDVPSRLAYLLLKGATLCICVAAAWDLLPFRPVFRACLAAVVGIVLFAALQWVIPLVGKKLSPGKGANGSSSADQRLAQYPEDELDQEPL